MAPPGTLERSPPPFFRQGASARSRLLVCAALAVFLMVADVRLGLTRPLRAALATALLPLQHAAQFPVRLAQSLGERGVSVETALAEQRLLRERLTEQAERIARADRLAEENERLRALLGLQQARHPQAVAAEVLYESPDPYARRLTVDRGSMHGVALTAPVITEAGVLGQVTRVYPRTAEVTLLTDRDASVPVLNRRTGQRGVTFGGAAIAGPAGALELELRYVATNADVQVDDELVTSGLDGIFPAGLPVARVASVQRQGETSFARVGLMGMASSDGLRHVLVLSPLRDSRAAGGGRP